jgi:hypothetical protein
MALLDATPRFRNLKEAEKQGIVRRHKFGQSTDKLESDTDIVKDLSGAPLKDDDLALNHLPRKLCSAGCQSLTVLITCCCPECVRTPWVERVYELQAQPRLRRIALPRLYAVQLKDYLQLRQRFITSHSLDGRWKLPAATLWCDDAWGGEWRLLTKDQQWLLKNCIPFGPNDMDSDGVKDFLSEGGWHIDSKKVPVYDKPGRPKRKQLSDCDWRCALETFQLHLDGVTIEQARDLLRPGKPSSEQAAINQAVNQAIAASGVPAAQLAELLNCNRSTIHRRRKVAPKVIATNISLKVER